MNITAITPAIIAQIKSRILLEDVIASYIPLNRHKVSCPFHQDKNPSLSIHTKKQIWKCFGCGKGGDVFSFLQLIENISFSEAVIQLAQHVGITSPKSVRLQEYIQRKWQAKSVKLERLNRAKAYLKQAFLDRRDELLQLRRGLPVKAKWNTWDSKDYLADQFIEYRFDLIDQKMKTCIADIEIGEEKIRHG